MRKLKFIIPLISLALVFSAKQGPQKVDPVLIPKLEPAGEFINNNSDTSPIFQYNARNSMTATLVDSSKNGYGIIVAPTRPLSVSSEGWIFGYRQWAGANGTSGQIGAAYSPNGISWTVYTNLNPGMGVGRYPSALGTPDYPYVFWNEYTGSGNPSYGGRPYYAFDEFGWDGGSWSSPQEIDNLWNENKDQWVLSPDYSFDAANGLHYFNVVVDDWTRENIWLFHSEAYFDGTIIFGSEILLFDEVSDFVSADDGGSYTSQAVLDINDSGVGFAVVTAYFDGANQGQSPYTNNHTLIFKMTTDYGNTWTGGQAGSPYYFLSDDVFDHMTLNGLISTVWDDVCFDEPLMADKPFLTYDIDLRVDSQGNPHFLVGLILSDGEFVYPGWPDNGIYHFTIDKDYLLNPGEPQSATGWNYSKVMATNDMWGWENADGGSYWQNMFPSLAISEEDDNVMWAVISGPDQGDFVVTDDAGTPDDDCDDLGYYPTWNEEVFVVKTENGGQSWWCPYNATQTPTDCWVDESGQQVCSDAITCSDGSTIDEPSEINAHAGTGATNDRVNIMFGRPDWCYGSTTGDMSGADHKNRYYVGWVELTSEDTSVCDDTGCPDPGDVNGDTNVDILDIVAIVNYIVNANPLLYECAGDYTGDENIDILDIVGIMNCILSGCAREDAATHANVIRTDTGLEITGNGSIGGVQITLTHDSDFNITLTEEALYGAYNTEGNKTTLVVVGLENDEIFTATGDYEIVDFLAASGDDYIDVAIVEDYALLSNYPNPFNPETTISYQLVKDGFVNVAVYNVLGQKVATLVNDFAQVGTYSVIWNGTNDLGSEVSSGLYILKLTTDNTVISNKITLLR